MSKGPEARTRKVLVVDDEEVLRKALARNLGKEGFEVIEAIDGTSAINLLSLEDFDAVLTDVHMPGRVSGTDLLQYVKQNKDIPVILMTGFAKLLETKEAAGLGASGFLAKPFNKEELLNMLRSALKIDDTAPNPGVDGERDEDFCKISINDFISGRQMKFNIFVRLSENRFVKVAHEGEDLSMDRIRAYKDKGINFLYMRNEHFVQYLQMNLVLLKAVQNTKKIDPARKMNLIKHSNDVLMEHFFHSEIDNESYEEAKAVVQTSLTVLAENPSTLSLLEILNQHSDTLYAHSLGVSLYVSLLARELKWDSPQTLFKLSIAGLFHDIGKKEIDRTILNKSRGELTMEETRLIESHSARGMEILSELSSFPADTLQVILQHHENCLGTGYPSKLSKTRIQPLARLMAVCDEFCDLVIGGPDQQKLTVPQAIERLFVLYADMLDVTFLLALAKKVNVDPSPWYSPRKGTFV